MSLPLCILLALSSEVSYASPAARPSAASEVERRNDAAGSLGRVTQGAADEFQVPTSLLLALAWEASHWNPDVRSEWGGYGLFDLREGALDPSLEHAAALLEVDPNRIIDDWRLQVRGAAAILADHGRRSNGGVLPDRADPMRWWDAVRAFSGREEPVLQEQFARYIFELLNAGVSADTRWGSMTLAPQTIDLTGRTFEPPPCASDSSLAATYTAASSENYSDYSRSGSDIDLVVIHTMQGSYSGSISWFQNPDSSASAHYMVRSSDGQITQMVKEADVAWHAGNWDYNERSVGLEHEGYIDDASWYTDAMYQKSAALTADIAARQGIPLDRSHIIGHNEVPDPDGSGYGGSGGHTDPGNYWDWDYYMSLIGGETGVGGGQIIGAVRDSDIYNGASLVGATVWIDETGDTTTVAADGYYRFDDLPFGSYTMHASYPGYAEGTCTKTTSSSQDWCSIALYPDDGSDDTGPAVDSGLDTGADVRPPPDAIGEAVLAGEVPSGCACATAPSSAGVAVGGLLIGLGLVVSRRRAS